MMYLAVISGGFLFLIERFLKARKRPDFLVVVFLQKNYVEALLNVVIGVTLVWWSGIDSGSISFGDFNITIATCGLTGFFGQWLLKLISQLFKYAINRISKYFKSKLDKKFKY